MATFFWKKGYISKPTIGDAARLSFNVIATDYMDHVEAITQKLKGITPAMDYNRLEQELADTKLALATAKKINLDFERTIHNQTKAIETQSNTLEHVYNTLKKEQQEFHDFRIITLDFCKGMQDIAKAGGYLNQEVRHFSEAPRIKLNERQTSVTEEEAKGISN